MSQGSQIRPSAADVCNAGGLHWCAAAATAATQGSRLTADDVCNAGGLHWCAAAGVAATQVPQIRPEFPDWCAGIQFSATAIYGGGSPGQGPAGAGTGSGQFGVCANGDLFYAPSVGGFYQKPGEGPVCKPACGPNTLAQGLYGSIGWAPFASPGMHNAQEMGGPFQTTIAGVGAGFNAFEPTSSTSGPTTVDSFGFPGMPGGAAGAGIANFETTTPVVYSYNWVGDLIDKPLVDTASDIHRLLTWSW